MPEVIGIASRCARHCASERVANASLQDNWKDSNINNITRIVIIVANTVKILYVSLVRI